MSLDNTEIEKIAWLSQLSLNKEEALGFSRDLNKILGLVEQMQAIDTAGIEPLAHPMEIKARLRQDKVNETDQREKFQEIAPAVENGYYLVPKVIE